MKKALVSVCVCILYLYVLHLYTKKLHIKVVSDLVSRKNKVQGDFESYVRLDKIGDIFNVMEVLRREPASSKMSSWCVTVLCNRAMCHVRAMTLWPEPDSLPAMHHTGSGGGRGLGAD